jgi:poly(3-hydroxyalkanoate) synthetase
MIAIAKISGHTMGKSASRYNDFLGEDHEMRRWPEWVTWLEKRSGAPVPALAIGAPSNGYAALCDAPGTYVLQE